MPDESFIRALDGARKSQDWEPPIPLDDAGPTLPRFPLHTLPAALQDLVCQAAASVGCPVDYPAAHALAVAAGAIGGSYDLQVKRGYYAPSNLWVCVVAPPGSGKSPAVAPVLAPVYREHARRLREKLDDGEQREVYVSDVTVEKLALMLCDNPRGLLMAWDEMAGWLTSFNQYKGGKGNDRSHYLSIWDGRAVKVDRKGKDSEPVFVPKPRLSIVGGIQPEVLDELRAGPSDGLFDRMLFSFPADPGLAVETWAEVDDAPCEAWAVALRNLWARGMHNPGGPNQRPNIVTMGEDARPVWKGWTEELAGMVAEKEGVAYYRSVAAKVAGYTARLALVVHLLREAYCEGRPQGVSAADMGDAVALAGYFLGHAERVYRAAGRDRRVKAAQAILAWAAGCKKEQWTRSDVWASLRRNSLFAQPKDLDEPLKLLELHRSIRWQGDDRAGPGRPPASVQYVLNPAHRGGGNGQNQTV